MGNNLWDQINEAYEEAHQVQKTIKTINGQLKSIKHCPYLLPCGSCDKRNGELCSQYK